MANEKKMPEWEGTPAWQEHLFRVSIDDPERAIKIAKKIPVGKFDSAMIDKFLNSEIQKVRNVGREISIMKETSSAIKEAFFRLVLFIIAFMGFSIVTCYVFANNPKQLFLEGLLFVVGSSVLFGIAAIVEFSTLLRLLIRPWLKL